MGRLLEGGSTSDGQVAQFLVAGNRIVRITDHPHRHVSPSCPQACGDVRGAAGAGPIRPQTSRGGRRLAQGGARRRSASCPKGEYLGLCMWRAKNEQPGRERKICRLYLVLQNVTRLHPHLGGRLNGNWSFHLGRKKGNWSYHLTPMSREQTIIVGFPRAETPRRRGVAEGRHGVAVAPPPLPIRPGRGRSRPLRPDGSTSAFPAVAASSSGKTASTASRPLCASPAFRPELKLWVTPEDAFLHPSLCLEFDSTHREGVGFC